MYQDENATAQDYKQYFPGGYQARDWLLSNKFIFITDILSQIKSINAGR